MICPLDQPTSIPGSLDPSIPSISFCGAKVYAERDGDHVTGRVEFPCEVSGKASCPIDYRSLHPGPFRNHERPAAVSDRELLRFRAVARFADLRSMSPKANKRALAKQVVGDFGGRFGVRSLQGWKRQFDLDGTAGLCDDYTPAPKAVLTIGVDRATECVKICARWAFRIGNLDVIDNKAMSIAAGLVERGYSAADLASVIDRYYDWPCDRQRYPFKSFARWVKHDLDVWVMRACEQEDYRRGLDAAHIEERSLAGPTEALQARAARLAPRAARQRSRETNHSRNRAEPSSSLRPSVPSSHPPSSLSPSVPSSRLSASESVRLAGGLRSIGMKDAARDVVCKAGNPARAAEPETIWQAIQNLDDGLRVMLIHASKGDKEARAQAIATMPLWWDRMPEQVRHNIDFKIARWHEQHPHANDLFLAQRKVAMFLPQVRSRRRGPRQLTCTQRRPRVVS